jgi:hypothetical protein
VTDVFDASLRFPTVVFTVLFAIVILMWVFALSGILDVTGADAGEGLFEGALEPFGLDDVPITVVLSILAVLGWFVSVLAQIHLLGNISGTALVVASVLVGVGAGGVGLGLAVVAAPVLGRVFETAEAPSGRELVGRTAEIRSATVTTTSGYADAIWPDGPVSRVEVRVSRHGDVSAGDLHSGDLVLLVDWDEPNNAYTVSRFPADLS